MKPQLSCLRLVLEARHRHYGKQLTYNSALLNADLTLSGQAARLLNKLAGKHAVSAGAPLGTAESTVQVAG